MISANGIAKCNVCTQIYYTKMQCSQKYKLETCASILRSFKRNIYSFFFNPLVLHNIFLFPLKFVSPGGFESEWRIILTKGKSMKCDRSSINSVSLASDDSFIFKWLILLRNKIFPMLAHTKIYPNYTCTFICKLVYFPTVK